MTALLLIAQGAAEALNQEPCQMKLGACQVRWVQRAQKRIRFNAAIKSLNEFVEGLIIADPRIDFGRLIVHNQMGVRPLKWQG